MIRIASLRQAVRLAELLESAGAVEYFEVQADVVDPTLLHVKEYHADGSLHIYFVDAEGNEPVKGGVGKWGIIPAQSRKD